MELRFHGLFTTDPNHLTIIAVYKTILYCITISHILL